MATAIPVSEKAQEVGRILTRGMQSGNVSFLLGSGASLPAIPAAGNVEKELNELLENDDDDAFKKKKFEFLSGIQTATGSLLSNSPTAQVSATLANYQAFLGLIVRLLTERKTNLLSKQVTVFTTNYDLFLEKASENIATINVNDGFKRTPSLAARYAYQSEHFFDITYKTGNLFNYQFAVPTVNLVKLHGSLSWEEKDSALLYRAGAVSIPNKEGEEFDAEAEEFVSQHALILPTKGKFHKTLMERVYYDLLRLYANRLELENSLLISFGFSFDDEHIRDITQRALKNPTLLLVIVAYGQESVAGYQEKFGKYNNVVILHPQGEEKIGFEVLNKLLLDVIPQPLHA